MKLGAAFVYLSLSTFVVSQTSVSTFPVAHLSVEEGLSQSTVTSIVQDREGFLWFATTDGLDRYDGTTFVVFKHDRENEQSLSSNDLTGLALSAQGPIWVGTTEGLCRYDKGTDAFSPLKPDRTSDSLPVHSHITKLLADREGLLWVGTEEGLSIIRLDSTSTLPGGLDRALPLLSGGGRVSALYEDRQGDVWVGSERRLIVFSRQKGTTVIATLPKPPAIIESIFEDSAGSLWFGSNDSRLFQYSREEHSPGDPSRWSVFPIRSENIKTPPANFVSAITEDNEGHLWIGTRLLGLFQFDRFAHSCERFLPPVPGQRFEGVSSFYLDRSGLLWVGYDGAGIVKINPNPEKFHHILLPKTDPTSSGDNFLKPVLADHRGRLWIGTYDQGLTVLDRATNNRIRYTHDPANTASLSDNSLLALTEDLRDRMWIGTTSGVDRFDERTASFLHFHTKFLPSEPVTNGAVWCLASDPAGVMWAGTPTRLLKFDEAGEKFLTVLSTDSVPDDWVVSLAAAPDLSVWVGTAKTGVLHVDHSGNVIEHYSASTPNTLCYNFVKCLSLQRDGILWIGTTEGLSRLDTRTHTWRSFHSKDGLPDETIYGILTADSVTRWFSTNRGLVRMSTLDPEHPRFRCYTPEDGLQSYEFNSNTYFKASTGEMMFGGINGLNTFFPDSVTDNPHVPPIVLTAFKKFDLPFNSGMATELLTSIDLRYSESVFSFEFAALEYTNPGRNSYAYMMEGYDRDWVQCGNRREARYTNLDPGKYVFRVRGSNNDGVWNNQGMSIAISIVPPFWRTTWFYAVSIVMLAGIFGGAVRYLSLRKIRMKVDRLEQEKAIELHRQETRERIAQDLHDDVSSTLSSMSLFVESSKARIQSGAQAAEVVLTRLHGMAREAEEAMEQAVWSLSPQHQRLSHLLARIHDVAVEQCQEHTIDCTTHLPGPADLPEDFVLSDVVRKNCYLIFRESLANVIRHSRARNMVLTIGISNGLFSMVVKDDGAGFNPGTPAPKLRGGNGLKNMHARAKEAGGSLEVRSHPGEGSTVRFQIQIAQMRY